MAGFIRWFDDIGMSDATRLRPFGDVSPHGGRGEPAPAAVAFDHVSLAFDDQIVLRDISFSVRAGHMTILLGASGAGKSVVLKLILGLLKPDFGDDPRQRQPHRHHERSGNDAGARRHRDAVPGKRAL